jgi:hypothetical protein
VIFGCAAVVNFPPNVFALILPVAVRLFNPLRVVIFAVTALNVFTEVLPATVKLVRVPTVVILGWLEVFIVPLIVDKLASPVEVSPLNVFNPVILAMVPADKVPLNIPPSITPLTDRFDNWPTDVIFGCAAVVNFPPNVFALILPVAVRLFNPLRVVIFAVTALNVFAATVPDTFKLLKVPTLVIFGCDAVVNVPLIVVILAKPVTVIAPNVVNPVILAMVPADKVPLNVPPSIIPLTDKLLNCPTDVIFGCAAVVNFPPNVVPVIAPDADTDIGVIFPSERLIEGVVVGLVTVAEIPLAAAIETVVTPVAGTFPIRT